MKKNKNRDPLFPDRTLLTDADRAEPACPLFGRCGGCAYQDVSVEAQRREKSAHTRAAFAAKGVELPEVKVHGGETYGYRNRMDFVFYRFPEYGLGLREKGSFRRMVDVAACPIALPSLQKALAKVREAFFADPAAWDPFDIVKLDGTLKYATIRATVAGDLSVTFVLNSESPRFEEVKTRLAAVAPTLGVPNVLWGTQEARRDQSIAEDAVPFLGSRALRESIMDRDVRFDDQCFFQNHTAMIRDIAARIREDLVTIPRSRLVDLYGGAGTFGTLLGDLASGVDVLDMQGPNLALAEGNVGPHAGGPVRIVESDAMNFREALGELPRPLVFLVDPPRAGLHPKALAALIETAPDHVFYVSCHPARLAEEMPALLAAYELVSLETFDLFPQTPHLEALAHLRRK